MLRACSFAGIHLRCGGHTWGMWKRTNDLAMSKSAISAVICAGFLGKHRAQSRKEVCLQVQESEREKTFCKQSDLDVTRSAELFFKQEFMVLYLLSSL